MLIVQSLPILKIFKHAQGRFCVDTLYYHYHGLGVDRASHTAGVGTKKFDVCCASRRYLIYSEADFEVFRPAGATRCTDGGEIWHEGGSVPSSVPNFTPIGATTTV